jgi:hypothetical protein
MPTLGKKSIIRHNTNLGLDKGRVESFSLKKFYFSEEKKQKENERRLSILKKRKVFISLPRLKKQLEERKKKSFLN